MILICTFAYLTPQESRSAQDDDTISLFVFGEDEVELAAVAGDNDGFVSYDKVSKHHFQYDKLPNQRNGVRI